MNKHLYPLFLSFCLVFIAHSARAQEEAQTLEAGKTVERKIAGGESQTYQIKLAAGQLVSFRLEQREIDEGLVLSAPDGKQIAEMNLTSAGNEESLSYEAAGAGNYRLTVQATKDSPALKGAYRLTMMLKDAATAQDRRRLTGEALLIEADRLSGNFSTIEQAVSKLEQSLPIWREINEPGRVVYTQAMLGQNYRNLEKYNKAMEVLQQALTISRDAKLRGLESLTLYNLAVVKSSTHDFEQSVDFHTQALAIKREIKDHAGEAESLQTMGTVYLIWRRADKALENLKQALPIYRELGNKQQESETLFSIGVGSFLLSRTDEAIAAYEQAAAISRELKTRELESRALMSLGVTSMSVSRFEKAIEYFEQAAEAAREVKNADNEAFALNGLGGAYGSLMRFDKAIEYSEKALVIARQAGRKSIEGQILLYMGGTYGSMQQFDKANEYLELALQRSHELRYAELEGKTLDALGGISIKQKRPEKAIEYYEQALANYRRLKNRPLEGSALIKLGGAYNSLGNYEKAAENTQEGLAIVREVKNREFELSALSTLARIESDRNNPAQSRGYALDGLLIAERLRTEEISNPTSRATFLSNVQSLYQLYTDLLMAQHKAEPEKGFDALAVETSERQRARSLLDLLAESKIDLRQKVDPTLLEREKNLSKQLNDKAQALTKADKPQQAAALRQDISQLETELERAQADIRKASPRFADLTRPQPLKLKEIQAQLDADTVLLEYSLGENQSYLWAISRDSLTSYTLPKEKQIEENALQAYELLTARNVKIKGETEPQRKNRIAMAEAKLPAAAKALSEMILKPAAAQMGNKRLVIVADGALQYIPFAMLPDLAGGKNQTANNNFQPLIVRHEIISLPSASALAIQRAELANRQPAPKTLAVIADPVFDKTDARFKPVPVEASFKPATQIFAPAEVRGLEYIADANESGKLVIRRLPFTEQEASELLALAPPASSFKATGFQASRETAMSGELANYRYVHFATHGLLDTERPGLSSLVLSMIDAQGKPENGFLRANDIYNMKLPAELVVLSACQTGLGKEIRGEGLVGLTRGFMYAGARRVAVSLWSVNDKATADLMENFYRGMLKNNERPAAALRAAQIEMWKQKAWQSPYYWSAFIIQGDWR